MKGRRGREYGRHFSLASTGTLKGHVTLQDVLCLRDSSPSKILARHALLFLLLSLGSLFSLSLFFSLPAFSYCHLCSSLAFQDYIPPFRAGSKTIRPPLASSAAKTFSQVSTRAIIDFFPWFFSTTKRCLLGTLVFLFTSFVSYIYWKFKKKWLISHKNLQRNI